MNIDWEFIKKVLYILGPIGAGFTYYHKIIESKFNKDLEKINYVKSLISESKLVALESEIYQARRVPREQFVPFDKLCHELETNQETLRFMGPTSSFLLAELKRLLDAYRSLRDLIQVSEWLPNNIKNDDGTVFEVWDFNKEAHSFTYLHGYPSGYGEHLDAACDQAIKMKKAFNRFQLVSELHIFESPFASFLLKRRFKRFELA